MGIFSDIKTLLRAKPAPPETIQSASPSQKKIIIVEDEAMLADALEIKFKQLGVTVLKAANGQIGLEMIQAEKPNVVLLDLMMPIMDGKTMLRKLREIPEFKDLPVFILTNAGDVDNMQETTVYFNAVEFIIKSNVDPSEIVELVKRKLK